MVLRWLALLIALPIGIFTVLALNMHASIGPDLIRDCGYAFRPCSVYALSDVRRITQVEGFRTKDGKLTKRAGVVLDFKDGRRWSSADWGSFRASVDPALAAFLRAKTGLPLNFAETEDDIPPLEGPSPTNKARFGFTIPCRPRGNRAKLDPPPRAECWDHSGPAIRRERIASSEPQRCPDACRESAGTAAELPTKIAFLT
jgi:hypothetical protein